MAGDPSRAPVTRIHRSACSKRSSCRRAADRRAGTGSRGSGGRGAPGQLAGILVRSRGLLEQSRQLDGAARVLDERLHRKWQSLDRLQLEGKRSRRASGSERRHDAKGRDRPVSTIASIARKQSGSSLMTSDAAGSVVLASGGNSSTVSRSNDASLGLRAAFGFERLGITSHQRRDRLDPRWSSRLSHPARPSSAAQIGDGIRVQTRPAPGQKPGATTPRLVRLPATSRWAYRSARALYAL